MALSAVGPAGKKNLLEKHRLFCWESGTIQKVRELFETVPNGELTSAPSDQLSGADMICAIKFHNEDVSLNNCHLPPSPHTLCNVARRFRRVAAGRRPWRGRPRNRCAMGQGVGRRAFVNWNWSVSGGCDASASRTKRPRNKRLKHNKQQRTRRAGPQSSSWKRYSSWYCSSSLEERFTSQKRL